MKTDIGISDKNRQAVAKTLNAVLADEYILYTKTRKFHWNVTGPHFNDLHKFFEAQYEELDGIVDEVAERVRSLGHISAGTLSEFSKQARLKEKPGQNPEAKGMLQELLSDHEAVIRTLRTDVEACSNDYADAGTGDFLTGIMEQHEKMAWMLRSAVS